MVTGSSSRAGSALAVAVAIAVWVRCDVHEGVAYLSTYLPGVDCLLKVGYESISSTPYGSDTRISTRQQRRRRYPGKPRRDWLVLWGPTADWLEPDWTKAETPCQGR